MAQRLPLHIWIPSTASGILKGYDPLLNLVLDGTIEYLQGEYFFCKNYAELIVINFLYPVQFPATFLFQIQRISLN